MKKETPTPSHSSEPSLSPPAAQQQTVGHAPAEAAPASAASDNEGAVTIGGRVSAFPVVGIGASAGGLEALQEFFAALPVDTGLGFVVVQHLSPTHPSDLAEILGRATLMPVAEATDGIELLPNHVYTIPPGQDMTLTEGRLQLHAIASGRVAHNIDLFFHSLAADCGHKALGVVLSGLLMDGAMGLEEIKIAGGITFAQDGSAQHRSMPQSAVKAGGVDFVLPPKEIAQELALISRHAYLRDGKGKSVVVSSVPTPEQGGLEGYARIIRLMQVATGMDFVNYKVSTLHRRIMRRMVLHNLSTLREYEQHLERVRGSIDLLFQDFLIGVTSFFRDAAAYEAVAQTVMARLVSDTARRESLRMWSVGCSTGEEAYSLAMIFTEVAEKLGSPVRLHLFGSDANKAAIEKARAGWYPASISQEVSEERLKRFFTPEEGGYRVTRRLRECCIFSAHDVLQDAPFSRLDFISCRNLLIYLEPVLQKRVFSFLHYALKPGGMLWLGSAEAVHSASPLFKIASIPYHIYLRRETSTDREAKVRFPVKRSPPAPSRHERPLLSVPRPTTLTKEAEGILLTLFSPPGVVISASMEILQYRGDTGAYLAPQSGTPSQNLLKMLREGLLVSVRNAILRAGELGEKVTVEDLRVKIEGGVRVVNVEVIPITSSQGQGNGYLVLFLESTTPLTPPHQAKPSSLAGLRADGPEVAHLSAENTRLTHELGATQTYLKSLVQQQELTNEELNAVNDEYQSSNEEMQSVNEELQSSKEEIQSSNEELMTLNDELNSRNTDLNELNTALRVFGEYTASIVKSIRSPLLVLDSRLCVKTASSVFYDNFRVTREATEGRLIFDLGNGQWNIPALRNLLEEILPRQQVMNDFEVEHNFDHLGVRRMILNACRLPQGAGKEPLVVLAIEDITDRKLAEEARLNHEQLYRTIGESLDYGIWICAPDGRNLYASPSFLKLVGLTQQQCSDEGWGSVLHPEESAQTMAKWQECVRTEGKWDHEHRYLGTDGQWHPILARGLPVKNAEGKVISWVGINLDIKRLKEVEHSLKVSEERFRMMANAISQLAWIAEPDGRITWFNQRWYDYTGTTLEESKNWSWQTVHDPAELPRVMKVWQGALASGEGFEVTFPLRGADGTFRQFLTRAVPLKDEEGNVQQWFGTNTDVNDSECARQALLQSDQRLRLATDAAELGIWSWDPVKDVATWENDRPFEIFGLPRTEPALSGERFAKEFLHPDDALIFQQAVEGTVLNGQPFYFQGRAHRTDGQLRWIKFTGKVEEGKEGGLAQHLVGTVEDITERKAAESALLASEARFRAAVGLVSSLVWTNSADGKMIGEQPGWGNFTGQTVAESQGYGWAKAIHPEDAQPTLDAWEKAVAEKRVYEFEHRVRRRDGAWRLCTVQAQPLLNENGLITEWVGVHTDITERKQREEEIRVLNQTLECRVLERTTALQAAVDALETEIAARERLEVEILEISEREQSRVGQDLHDGLCQELAGTAMLANVLAMRLKKEGHPSAAAAEDVAQCAVTSIETTRGIAKGLYPVELGRAGLLVALENLAQQATQRLGIDCQFIHDGHPVKWKATVEIHLYRIVQECINNALKHGEASQVIIEFLRSGEENLLTVTDNGVGLAEAVKTSGMGMQTMSYRARVIGATLDFSRPPEGGCRVTCRLGK